MYTQAGINIFIHDLGFNPGYCIPTPQKCSIVLCSYFFRYLERVIYR